LDILLARRNDAQNAQKPKRVNLPSQMMKKKSMNAVELEVMRAKWACDEMLEVAQQPAPRHNEGESRPPFDAFVC
jgi:hypothetical protein